MSRGRRHRSDLVRGFALGVVACASLAASGWFYIRRPSIVLAWWIVLFTYLGACYIAIRQIKSP